LEYTSTSANNFDDGPLGATNQHIQQVYSSSLLSGLNVGDQITAIGFRIVSNGVSVASQTVPDYSIWMGTAALSPSNMSSTFASNRGVDFTMVRSGALNITPGQFPGGPGNNPFGYISFNTPYTYTGGNLLIELSYANFPLGGASVEDSFPYDANLAETAFGTGPGSTTADVGLYNEALVMSFMVTPIPEPTTMALIAMGLVGLPLLRTISVRRK
jgi:hypothetical protein